MKRFLLLAVILAAAVPLSAAAPAASTRSPLNGNGFRTEYLAGLDDVQKKLTSLAEAIPETKYAWRPGEGVRSVGEVYGHIAGSNYFLLTFVGKQPPSNMPKDMEKIAEKARLLAELRKSFEFLRAAALAETEAELRKPVKMLGNPTTRHGVYITTLNHLHEHLGQLIAYARMNGVIPPWSH